LAQRGEERAPVAAESGLLERVDAIDQRLARIERLLNELPVATRPI
jgi:hypothetical protein